MNDIKTPAGIERESMRIIDAELSERGITLASNRAAIVRRVIHATADFEYAHTMRFSEDVLAKADEALKKGAHIVTDTNMAYSGINKAILKQFGGEAHCCMADPDVAAEAKERGVTRATVCMEKALRMNVPMIFAIGNAPTALVALYEAIRSGRRPELIIGVPVGFVNVVQSKELIMETDVPYIINEGRKGGSNVAAAICNALMYRLRR